MTDQEPRETQQRRGVPPGETPPGEGSTTGALGHPEPPELRRAWGPVPVIIILAFGIGMAVLFAVMAVVVALD